MTPRPLLSAALALPLAASPLVAMAQETALKHITGSTPANGVAPPFSRAVIAGDTIYLAGMIDGGGANRPNDTAEAASKRALDALKANVEAAGATMDDLTWVQVFCTDLSWYGPFNEVYRTYFKGPMPARAFIGASQLLNGSHFEIMGIAVKRK